jgi:hypothetical protein
MEADIDYIAAKLRQADIEELKATHGEHCVIRDILIESVRITPRAKVYVSEAGEPVALFGCAPNPQGGGIPWMLATDKAPAFPVALVDDGRWFVQGMLEEFGSLVNYVDVRNARSIRWLACIGFTIHPPEPFGVQGLPFHKFTLTGTRIKAAQA